MELKFQVDRIPAEGLELRGLLEPAQLSAMLAGQRDVELDAPAGADIDLRVDRIDDSLRISGTARARIVGACARCLESASHALDARIDVTLFREGSEQARKRLEPDEDGAVQLDSHETMTDVYTGNTLDLQEMLRELVLLELPMRLLCRDGCAGLCDQCGHNLNQGPCACVRDSADLRWDGLKRITLPPDPEVRGANGR